jgi:hypothetical protein
MGTEDWDCEGDSSKIFLTIKYSLKKIKSISFWCEREKDTKEHYRILF